LYSTCRQATFAEDCQRILGLTLDELDRKYWQYVERKAAGSSHLEEQLKNMELADYVDRDSWNEFASVYPRAVESLKQPFRQIQLVWVGSLLVTASIWRRRSKSA
jgi:hypothetical protein